MPVFLVYIVANLHILSPMGRYCHPAIIYCKTLIIRVTLFLRGHQLRYIHEILFSGFVIFCSIILTLEIIVEDFISRLYALVNLRENKVLANKKCFTVC